MRYLVIAALVLSVLSCGSSKEKQTGDIEHFYAPAAGTVVAADSMRSDDLLNEAWFCVYLVATEESNEGKYQLKANYGANEAKADLVYPALTETVVPAVRIDKDMPYSFIAGFRFKDKEVFNDYLRINANRVPGVQTQVQMQYLKAYYVDTTK